MAIESRPPLSPETFGKLNFYGKMQYAHVPPEQPMSLLLYVQGNREEVKAAITAAGGLIGYMLDNIVVCVVKACDLDALGSLPCVVRMEYHLYSGSL